MPTTLPDSEYATRLTAVRTKLAGTDADAAGFFSATSIDYLTGFDHIQTERPVLLVVTPDEVGDVHDLDIWAEVNDERLQDSNTSQLIFDVGEVVSFCSRAFTLEPGDLVYTGTPAGVGYFRDPKVLLDDGDTVTVGVEGVGELTNECRHV